MKKITLLSLVTLLLIFFTGQPGFAKATFFKKNLLLKKIQKSQKKFEKRRLKNKTVYFHQRKLNGAIVENDFIRYTEFDALPEDMENVMQEMHWRTDLPENSIPAITKAQAEAMVEGEVQYSKLYLISPASDVFPLAPTPQNPCWVVVSLDDGKMLISVIDAVGGKFLGYGIPPPQATGFSFTGPQYWNPCDSDWTRWYLSARDWFNTMGYPTETAVWPLEDDVRYHIQSMETAVFYEVAHGDSLGFKSGCTGGTDAETTFSSEVRNWIEDYPKMPFAFLATCGGMCSTGSGTLSDAFRKGSDEDTTTVGYCDMDKAQCFDCWSWSRTWQNRFFEYLNAGDSVKDAYDQTMADFPLCAPAEGSCIRFAGDENLTLVPVINRDGTQTAPPPSACIGDFNGDGWVDSIDLAIFSASYGQQGNNPADLNGDGWVDSIDLAIFSARYGSTCP